MNNKMGEIELNRLKNLLKQDKVNTPDSLTDVLRSDLYGVLRNYMEIRSEDLKVIIDADDKGYVIIVSARTNRFKQIGMLPRKYDA
jgi:septum formation topological specificity factor MinE